MGADAQGGGFEEAWSSTRFGTRSWTTRDVQLDLFGAFERDELNVPKKALSYVCLQSEEIYSICTCKLGKSN